MFTSSTRKTAVIITLFTLTFFLGYILGQSPFAPVALFGPQANTPADAEATFSPFWEVWDLVHARYFIQPIDNAQLTQGAIDGMLATLDDQNTRYLPPDDEEAARESIDGEFQGIGTEIESIDGHITVISPFEGSPAEGAGLQPGDIIQAADGTDLTGMDPSEAAKIVRGPAGTAVTLTIIRDGETFDVEIIRDVIKLRSVRGELLEQNIAYIRLSRFADKTAEELETELETLLKNKPSGLILDLRRNPGGLLGTAVDVADQFLSPGTILIEEFGNGQERIYEATRSGLAENIPLVVLIDEGSASASEVLAGAIRDRERGTLIGVTSFGKGTVQTWQTLSNGGGLRLTIARWLTPNRTWVHKTGLTPDFVVELPDVENQEDFVDTQLETAVNYLTGATTTQTTQPQETN